MNKSTPDRPVESSEFDGTGEGLLTVGPVGPVLSVGPVAPVPTGEPGGVENERDGVAWGGGLASLDGFTNKAAAPSSTPETWHTIPIVTAPRDEKSPERGGAVKSEPQCLHLIASS